MKTTHLVFASLFGFLIGCAASAIATNTVVPPLNAQQDNTANPSVVRWSQHCERVEQDRNVYRYDKLNQTLRKFGAEGWELVLVQEKMVCFKKPL